MAGSRFQKQALAEAQQQIAGKASEEARFFRRSSGASEPQEDNQCFPSQPWIPRCR